MKNKLTSLLNKPVVLLAAAAVLLLAGTVGSTQAALVHESEDYKTVVDASNIGVGIVENGETVSNGLASTEEGSLMTNLLVKGDNGEITENNEFVLGKTFVEELAVENTGDMDSYVRVIITKKWLDANGNVDRTLSPNYIDLKLVVPDSDDWVKDDTASTAERTVLYYTKLLPAKGITPIFSENFRISEAFETTVEMKSDTVDGFTTITYEHPFKDYTFVVEVEAQAIQTYDAVKAIKSEWGVNAEIDKETGILSIVKTGAK